MIFFQQQQNAPLGHHEADIRALCKEYHERICVIESDKYDMEKEVDIRDYKVDKIARTMTSSPSAEDLVCDCSGSKSFFCFAKHICRLVDSSSPFIKILYCRTNISTRPLIIINL